MLSDIPFPKYISPLKPIPTAETPGGSLRDPVRCIMFDVYGTLFISASGDIGMARERQARTELLEELIHRHGLGMSSQELRDGFFTMIAKSHRSMGKKGVDVPEVAYEEIWKAVLPIGNDENIRRFAVEYELIVNPVYPMPNLKRLLAGCRDRKLAMGIISNAQFFTPLLFEWFLGGPPDSIGFDLNLLFYSYLYQVAKPSPLLFEAAVSALADRRLAPSEVLYVGNDMLNDIYAANGAGFQTALFAGDARSLRMREDREECRKISPDLVVTDLGQILDYL